MIKRSVFMRHATRARISAKDGKGPTALLSILLCKHTIGFAELLLSVELRPSIYIKALRPKAK